MFVVSRADVLAKLQQRRLPLRALCEAMGIRFPSSRRWSRRLVRASAWVSRVLQRLRRAGRVRYVRAPGWSGWELAA